MAEKIDTEVVSLAERRQPVSYTVRITHHWDDSLEVFVEDVADDERSRDSVSDALYRASGTFYSGADEPPKLPEKISKDELIEHIGNMVRYSDEGLSRRPVTGLARDLLVKAQEAISHKNLRSVLSDALGNNHALEAAAKAIYDLIPYDGPTRKPQWVENGNSFKQDEARRYAEAALSAKPKSDASGGWGKAIGELRGEVAADAQVTGWQPIETAPRDGTRILIWIEHTNAKFSKDPVADGWVGVSVARWVHFNGGGWMWSGLCGFAKLWQPLLWQTLPITQNDN